MRVILVLVAQASQRTFDVMLWIGVLLVGLLVMLGVLAWIKRRFENAQESDTTAPPFTLHDLAMLRDTGKMSEDEYQRAKQRLIAMTRVAIMAKPTPESGDKQKSPPEMPDGA